MFTLPRSALVALTLTAVSGIAAAAAAELDLYMDTATKQLYAEPGPGRVHLGRFRSVEEAAAPVVQNPASPPPGVAPSPAPKPAAPTPPIEERVAKLEKHDADQTRTPFTSRFSMRGYVQVRYSELLSGDRGINLWSDRSVGDRNSLADQDKNFLIRRARLIFQGDVGQHLSFYVQPDFASTSASTNNLGQLRDAYGDYYLTTDRVHRLRIGQSKVPYGFENMQSSSNRLALDRADAMNSAVRDERDLGVFYYWTPKEVQARFNDINAQGLKHSGNYGLLGLGVYNGQGANRSERNDGLHSVVRASYPWKLTSGQYFEAGVQAYRGSYVPTLGTYRAPGDVTRTPTIAADRQSGFDDERVGVSAIWYPQPFGLQAEWNWGRTPALDLAGNRIIERGLDGGYVQAMMRVKNRYGTFFPFVRWQTFDGANKGETNAPMNHVDDLEFGLEWQIVSEAELSLIYHSMKRNNLVTGNQPGRIDYEHFDTDALRVQVQFNF